MSRRQDVLEARMAADAWAAERNLPASGGYSGRWYIDGYLSGWWPADWLQWLATYDNNPGSQLGGDVVGHQYSSTPVDQSVFIDSEIVGDPVDDDDCQAYKDALDRGVQRLWIETAKKTTLSKKIIKEIAAEMYAALQS